MQNSSQGTDASQRGTFLQFTAAWGLYMGLLLSLFSVLSVGLRILDYAWALSLCELTVVFVMTGRAMVVYRRTQGGGLITYGRAFRVGAMQSVFAAVIVASVYFVMIEIVVPDYVDYIYQTTLKMMREQISNEELFERTVRKSWAFSMMRHPLFQLLSTLVNGVFNGLIASLFMGIFVRRAPQTPTV